MRSLLLLTTTLIFTASLFAQEGIDFSKSNWKDILAKAKAEDKAIFMDAYTTWCGPCKMMSRQVFTDASVGTFYNENFINAKIDMEAGEGIELAELYEVRAYPTLLFIDGDGQLLHRAVGYHDAEQFVKLGRDALDPSSRLSTMSARFAEGDRNPEFLYRYALAAMNSMSPDAEAAVQTYLENKEDWSDVETMQLIFESAESADSKLFDYIIEKRAAFAELYGEYNVLGKLQQMIISSLDPSGTPEETLAKADAQFQKAFPEDAAMMSANFRMNYFRMLGQVDEFAETAINYYEKYGSESSMELNNIAWSFFENVEDQKMLEKAVKWAEKSVELEDAYYNNDTLASLYYKTGDKKKAKKAAEHAIELAKENGEDYSATKELLDKIKKM
ncbi:MAG: thioredoxin fold domain-containing protein [Phaeodactylibacter sp.]|nr:thioredoxin fold domain-containing protein [Phaeodactylibacter sp.]MCB9052575.1 thioredoxin fold domain-containing protein [Lewinellaceae bacterium]